jgi:hypothetical protein
VIHVNTYSVRSGFVDRELRTLIQRYTDGSHMIDVARLRLADTCPRCIDRRVYAVDEDRNLWLCIANAMPVPWRRDQVREHDAAEFLTQDPQVNHDG